eukprot:scaffold20418_cov112-Isochrysis_galbana.AAC.6
MAYSSRCTARTRGGQGQGRCATPLSVRLREACPQCGALLSSAKKHPQEHCGLTLVRDCRRQKVPGGTASMTDGEPGGVGSDDVKDLDSVCTPGSGQANADVGREHGELLGVGVCEV